MGRRRSQIKILFILAVVRCAAAQTTSDPTGDTLLTQDDEFRLAFEHARAGDAADAADSDSLRRHPLYLYLRAERLAAQLNSSTEVASEADAEVSRFLTEHEGEPVIWQLRYTWLTSLARREQWEEFLEQYRDEFADERLSCQYLAARIALDRIEGIAPAIVRRWLTPRQLPSECEPVFQWLRDEGALTDAHIEQRVRLLLEDGHAAFARIIARRLPEEHAAPLLKWADLIENPGAELAAYLENPSDDVEPDAVFDAWQRLSRDQPDTALNLYAPLMRVFPVDDGGASAYTLALALGLAWDRRRESLDFFAMAASSELDDYALEWRTRAALWAGDWALAGASISAMSDVQRATARWRYWNGRVVELQHGRRRARDAYRALLEDDNYYSGLAAARLRRRLQPRLEPLPRDAVTVANLSSREAFVRARALLGIGLPAAALREWRYGFSRLDSGAQRQAIHLAADWQWYDLAVATATRFGVFNDYALLYPRPFGGAVDDAVRSTDLGAELVYGVIRQESLYRADAVSSAGARGLMQLQPGTAARIVRRLDEPGADRVDLLDPAVNIHLGTAELERLLEHYDGSLPVALAAYNAGPNAADRWLPDTAIDTDIWIENVPFNETRTYVQRVLWHSLVFRWLETQRPQNTRAWLDRVPQAKAVEDGA